MFRLISPNRRPTTARISVASCARFHSRSKREPTTRLTSIGRTPTSRISQWPASRCPPSSAPAIRTIYSPVDDFYQRLQPQLRRDDHDEQLPRTLQLVFGKPGDVFLQLLPWLEPRHALQTQQNGTIVLDQAVTLASITDGTSNTFIYGEKAHGYFAVWDTTYQYCDTVWISPLYFDTLFTTFYPPNVPTSSTPGLTLQGFPITLLPMRQATMRAA